MDNRELFKVCISGACGKIAYSLFNSLGSGDLFGPHCSIDLRLLDLPDKRKELQCLLLELEDCAFPLLEKVSIPSSAEEAFEDLDFAILLGGFPRKPGMERTDLFEMNHTIFEQEGSALNKKAKRSCKVIVIANPANNNCLTLSKFAVDIPKKNFTCLMRLDYNRTKTHVAIKANRKVKDVRNVIVWGNHSPTVFPDLCIAEIGKEKVKGILPAEWMEKELISEIQLRGGKILMQKGISSCLAAAQAIIDHIKDWRCGSQDILSMGVIVEEDLYEGLIPSNLCVSLPVRCLGNYQYQIVSDLVLNEFQKEKIKHTIKQLTHERQLLNENKPDQSNQ